MMSPAPFLRFLRGGVGTFFVLLLVVPALLFARLFVRSRAFRVLVLVAALALVLASAFRHR